MAHFPLLTSRRSRNVLGVNLQDTQNQPDYRQLPIDRVGVKNLRYPIQVRDKHHAMQSTIATAQLTVDLPHHLQERT